MEVNLIKYLIFTYNQERNPKEQSWNASYENRMGILRNILMGHNHHQRSMRIPNLDAANSIKA